MFFEIGTHSFVILHMKKPRFRKLSTGSKNLWCLMLELWLFFRVVTGGSGHAGETCWGPGSAFFFDLGADYIGVLSL